MVNGAPMKDEDYSFILKLKDAVPFSDSRGLPPVEYNLTIEPGGCVFVECQDEHRTSQFMDFCCGLLPVQWDLTNKQPKGFVSCMGLEWGQLNDQRAQALRGRIGRVMAQGGWIDLYEMHLNILWPSLHHSWVSYDKLVEEAVGLCQNFGLPGLPTQLPEKLSVLDRKRAEYVRAFMNKPSLLLLENPLGFGKPEELCDAFLAELTIARERGCAVLWVGSDCPTEECYGGMGRRYFRLGDNGLIDSKAK